jgi:Zn-dependent oligopeptidase
MVLSMNRIAERPENVQTFLTTLSEKLNKKAMSEIALLKSERGGSAERPISPWDVPFYTAKLKSRTMEQRYFQPATTTRIV